MTAPGIFRGQTRSAAAQVDISGLATVTGSDSAIELAARAGRAAITDAGLPDDSIDVLIHVGVYRDDNIVEPAVAALVQKRIGIGLDYARGDNRMYSFDLMNGACGVLDALAVGAALLSTGARSVLITAADAHPGGDSPDRSAGFPYAPAGAAMVLTRGTGSFGELHTASSSSGPVGYLDIPETGAAGRRMINVEPVALQYVQPLVDDVLARTGSADLTVAAVPEGVTLPGSVLHVREPVLSCGPILALAAIRGATGQAVRLLAAGAGAQAAAMVISRSS